MKLQNNVLQFYPVTEDTLSWSEPPQPGIRSNIPNWLRKTPKYRYGQTKFVFEGESNLSIRNCIPFLESFTTGYVMTLPCDIQVRTLEDGSPRITWGGSNFPNAPVTSRPFDEVQYPQVPLMEGFDRLQFNWMPQWSVKTKKGYSCLFIHPINRVDLPFYTLGGVVDTDRWGEAGNHPFLLKKGWEGIIEKGTPVVQIIPFKRESWKSELKQALFPEYLKKIRERDRTLIGWYKKNAWATKSYK